MDSEKSKKLIQTKKEKEPHVESTKIDDKHKIPKSKKHTSGHEAKDGDNPPVAAPAPAPAAASDDMDMYDMDEDWD